MEIIKQTVQNNLDTCIHRGVSIAIILIDKNILYFCEIEPINSK